MLTLDRSMQYETERALSQEILAAKAKGGIAIVSDPRSGDILAMASLVAGANGAAPGAAPSNEAATKVYEPGSANKAVTIAGALQEGIVTPATKIAVPDHITVGTAQIGDDEPHPTGAWTVTDIVANSSNVGTIEIGEKLGKAGIDRYLRAFGLGSTTALHFPGESAGLLLDPKRWSGASIATVPIPARTRKLPKKMSAFSSPSASTCAPAHSIKPHIIGCRVMRIMPRAGSWLRSSPSAPTIVGLRK